MAGDEGNKVALIDKNGKEIGTCRIIRDVRGDPCAIYIGDVDILAEDEEEATMVHRNVFEAPRRTEGTSYE